jgi:hypothetical protein
VWPDKNEFDKEKHDTYEAYHQYYDDLNEGQVNIEFRPRDNVAAAGRVLRDLCAKNKFCHSLPRLDVPVKKPRAKKAAPTVGGTNHRSPRSRRSKTSRRQKSQRSRR